MNSNYYLKFSSLLILIFCLVGCGQAPSESEASPQNKGSTTEPVTVETVTEDIKTNEKVVLTVVNEDCLECDQLVEWIEKEELTDSVRIINLSQAEQKDIDELLELEPELNRFPTILLVKDAQVVRRIDQIELENLLPQLTAFIEEKE